MPKPPIRRGSSFRNSVPSDMLPCRMTICIAAIAPKAEAIVTVSDTMLSFGDWDSSDMAAVKIHPTFNGWYVMYAGNPTLDYELRWHLYKWLKDRDSPRSMPEMMDGLRHSYDTERAKVWDRYTQSRYGCNHDVLMNTGRQRFGDAGFASVISELSDIKYFDTEQIACGFDDIRVPHMLVVKADGACDIYDEVGFHAIGAGDIRAQTYLHSYSDFRYKSLGEVCYRLQAAKFMAENSPFVGPRQTITTVYHFDGRISYNHGAAASREYFDAEIARAIPDETLAAIEGSLSAGPAQF